MNADVNPPKRKRIRKRQQRANTHDQINSVAGMLADKLRLMISPQGPNYDPDVDDDELVELLEGIEWLAELAHQGVKGKQPLSWDEKYPKRVKETERRAALERKVFVPLRIRFLRYYDKDRSPSPSVQRKHAKALCIEDALTKAKAKGIKTTPWEVKRVGDFDRLLVERNKAERRPKR